MGKGVRREHGRAGMALLPPFPLVGALSHFLRELAVAHPGAWGARPSAAVGESRRAPCLAFVCNCCDNSCPGLIGTGKLRNGLIVVT